MGTLTDFLFWLIVVAVGAYLIEEINHRWFNG